MSTAAAHNLELHERVEALRAAICAALRPVPCVLLALLLGVLNPALCVLHCALLHPAAPATLAAAPGHAHHGHAHHGHANATPASGSSMGLCTLAGHAEHAPLTPRASYEGTPVALGLALLILVLVAQTLAPPSHPRLAQRPQPLTPPPQPLAFR
jgi:hypothetical protein